MKKLIPFVAALLAIATVQAASVQWTVNKQTDLKSFSYAIIDPSVITALVGGASPYADEAAYNAALSAKEAFSADGLTTALTSAGTVNGKGTVAAQSIDNVSDSLTFIFWNGTPADGGTFYYGTYSTAAYQFDKPSTPPGTLSVAYADLSAGTFTAATFNQAPGPDPVPEPTSVALLALGLAAVGLKRKIS